MHIAYVYTFAFFLFKALGKHSLHISHEPRALFNFISPPVLSATPIVLQWHKPTVFLKALGVKPAIRLCELQLELHVFLEAVGSDLIGFDLLSLLALNKPSLVSRETICFDPIVKLHALGGDPLIRLKACCFHACVAYEWLRSFLALPVTGFPMSGFSSFFFKKTHIKKTMASLLNSARRRD
jgi:hypothetical protein